MRNPPVDHIIVTRRSPHRVRDLSKHRRKRVRKKWGGAVVMSPRDLVDPVAVLGSIRLLTRYVPLTDRCERQVARYLRRSGVQFRVATPAERRAVSWAAWWID